MAMVGCRHWYFAASSQQSSSIHRQLSTPAQRLLTGHHVAADTQNQLILIYQLWDLAVSVVVIPEFRADPIFLVHHVLAAAAAYTSWQYQVMSYYAVYFGGCAEVSSVPLVWADMDEMFVLTTTTASSSLLACLVIVCKGLFVLLFAYFRVGAWMWHSVAFWRDAGEVLAMKATTQRREAGWLIYFFLVLNVLLGALQLFWMASIVHKVYELVTATSPATE